MRIFPVLVLVFLLLGCSRAANKPYWSTHCDVIEHGKYQACYGPGIKPNDKYERLHSPAKNTYLYYRVTVERIVSDTMTTSLFSREFTVDQVRPALLTEAPVKMVTYNKSTGIVQFNVSNIPVTYLLQLRNGP